MVKEFSIFGEAMDKTIVSGFFMTHGVYAYPKVGLDYQSTLK